MLKKLILLRSLHRDAFTLIEEILEPIYGQRRATERIVIVVGAF